MSVDLCKHLELPELCEACKPVKVGQNGHDPSRAQEIPTLVVSSTKEEQEQAPKTFWRSAKKVREAAESRPNRYWPVPGFLAPGLSLLFAAPKTGKTRLLIDVGWSVATGNPTLGSLATHQGDVLMVLSETSAEALNDIWETTFPDEVDVPDRLSLVTLEDFQDAARTYSKEPIKHIIDGWRRSVEKPVLVVVDNLANCVMPWVKAEYGEGVAERDRRMLNSLQHWASEHALALVMVHHNNKAKLEKDASWLTAASGSHAITATVDDLYMLYGEDESLGLKYKGRSLGRSRDWTLTWRAGRIHMFDTVEVTDRLGDQMLTILKAVASFGGDVTVEQIAARSGIPQNTVKRYLSRLAKNNLVVRSSRGVYRIGAVEEAE